MIELNYIDNIANTIADLTGPNEDGLVKIGKVEYKNSPLTFLFGRIRDTTDPNEKGIGVSKYGYSSGDIVNLCNFVINRAAQRALCVSPDSQVGYIHCNHVLANGDIKTYLVYTHYKTQTGDILDPNEYFKTLKSLVKSQGGEIHSDKLVLKLKHNERFEITDTIVENGKCYIDFKNKYLEQGKNVEERIRNFSIFLEDFKNALKTNKPAISNEEYESYIEDKSN
jgi:hypothetical protein